MYVHDYAEALTYTQILVHTYIYVTLAFSRDSRVHAHLLIHTHIHTRALAHTHTHAHINTHTHADIYKRTHAHNTQKVFLSCSTQICNRIRIHT